MKILVFLTTFLLVAQLSTLAQDTEPDCSFHEFLYQTFGHTEIYPIDSVLIAEGTMGNRAYYALTPMGWTQEGELFLMEDNSYLIGGYQYDFISLQCSPKKENRLLEFHQEDEKTICETVEDLTAITNNLLDSRSIIIDSTQIGYINQFGNDFFRYRGFNSTMNNNGNYATVEINKYGATKKVIGKYKIKKLPPAWPGEPSCHSSYDFAGYFINPFDPMQIIIHVFEREGCGFENAESFNNLFIPIDLNTFQ